MKKILIGMVLGVLAIFSMAFKPVHFSSDSFVLEENQTEILNENIVWLKDNPGSVIILEGHCDEWGKDSYNMELGDRRAREIKAYLIEKGINPERIIMVVSFGEKMPLDQRHNTQAWAVNRRVEFVLR